MIGILFENSSFVTKFGNQFGNIELDATLEETHEWMAEATMNPVEEGAPVTDHVIEQPDKIRIKGFITNSPITSGISFSQISKTQEVVDMLYDLIKEKEPVTLYTKYRVYTEMVLTNVSIPRAAGVGDAIEFNADFVNIRKVATQSADIPPGIGQKKTAKTPASVQKKAEPTKDAGKKQTEPVPKKSSQLQRLFP